MTSSARRISLFVTLGIAAIDMLSCSFIASILLFLMFLLPSAGAGGGAATGSEKLLAFQWTIASSTAVLNIVVGPSTDSAVSIWSDDPDALTRTRGCALLSKQASLESCRLFITSDAERTDGMLIIKDPKVGEWNAAFSYADSRHHLNISSDPATDVNVMVIGSDTITATVSGLAPLHKFDVRTEAAQRGNPGAAIAAVLNIE